MSVHNCLGESTLQEYPASSSAKAERDILKFFVANTTSGIPPHRMADGESCQLRLKGEIKNGEDVQTIFPVRILTDTANPNRVYLLGTASGGFD